MKKRLDILVYENGFTDSREKAKAVIMAGQVYVDNREKVNFIRHLLPCNLSHICAFKVYNPFIVSEFPSKLTVTYINGINFLCAVLQHTVGKSACRSTYIHSDFSV